MADEIPPRGLSVKQAAIYCGVSEGLIRRHAPKPMKIGNRKVYDRKALDEWFDGPAAKKKDSRAEAEAYALKLLEGMPATTPRGRRRGP